MTLPALPWWAWLVAVLAVLYYLRTRNAVAAGDPRGEVEIGAALVGEREIRRAATRPTS